MDVNSNLPELISATLSGLEASGYSPKTINGFKWKYATLERFCAKNHIERYDENIGEQFLDLYRNRQIPISKGKFQTYCRYILRLNCTLADTDWKPIRRPPIEYASSCYNEIVAGYEAYLYTNGQTRKHVRIQIHVVARFLNFLEQHNRLALNDLDVSDIYTSFQNSSNKGTFRRCVSPFLKYAHKYKLAITDLSLLMPDVVKREAVPSVYSTGEVEQLLNSIDRTTSIGKRDYAMILIAARLGLRASDIAGMTFDDLCASSLTIKITQAKTKRPLTLPLLGEVNAALSDYVENARPTSDDEHIFLNADGLGVIRPGGVGQAVKKAFVHSGIECGKRKQGSHSLRASLATALLDEGNDYSTIQQVLGHSDIQSTKYYVKASVEKLRVNALPVPPPGGSFKLLLLGGCAQ